MRSASVDRERNVLWREPLRAGQRDLDTPVGATFGDAVLKRSSAYRPYANGGLGLLQIAGSYRVSRFFALGGLASTTVAEEGEQHFWHVAGEARLLALTSRFVEIWGAAELGLAATTYSPSACGDCGPVRDADLRAHFAPIFGPGAGVDFLPIKYVSLGVEGRALVPIYPAAPVAEGPTGVAPVFMFGLTLAAHIATD